MIQGNLLVVDDEEDILEAIKLMLVKTGITFIPASSGLEALEIIRTQRVDAILSDLSMPKMNGLEFLKKVREANLETPFVFLTGHGAKEKVVEALRLGAADFLDKPFERAKLLEVIYKAVEYGVSIKELEKEVSTMYSESNFSEEKRLKMQKLKTSFRMMSLYGKIYNDNKE